MKFTHFAFVALAFKACANAAPIGEAVTPVTTQTEAEMGDYYQGDMIVSKVRRKYGHEHNKNVDGFGIGGDMNTNEQEPDKRWPEGTVVYQIRDDYNAKQMKIINDALDEIANKSCIKFRAREGNEHAVVIANNGKQCYSYVGYSTTDSSGEPIPFQELNIGLPCLAHGIIVHEMLHTLGFYHTQSAYNRDNYVKIEFDNIEEGKELNFLKETNETVPDFGVDYDYGSIMHYGEYAFTMNEERTIVPLQEGAVIGQREKMSDSDVLKLQRMYGCADS